jgi:hypothetical protein
LIGYSAKLGFGVTYCPTHSFLDFAAHVPGRSGYAIFVHLYPPHGTRLMCAGSYLEPAQRWKVPVIGDCVSFERRIPVLSNSTRSHPMGRGILLWLIGIPIPIILLIWLFGGLHG